MLPRITALYHLGLLCVLALACQLRAADAPVTRPKAPYENDIRKFEQSDRENPPPQHANLFVGSSTIRFWTSLPKDFPNAQVINRGFGGSQLADSVRYAPRIVIPYHPARIFLYAGDNDIAAGKSPRQVANDFEAFDKEVHAALPDTDIYYLSIKPSPSRAKFFEKDREANRLIEQYCKDHPDRLHFLDMFTIMLGPDGKPRPELFRPDMLHMNVKGYAMWAQKIAPLVK